MDKSQIDWDYLCDEYSEESSLRYLFVKVLFSSDNDVPDVDIFLRDKNGIRHFKSNESLDKISVQSFEQTMSNELNEICKNYENNLIQSHHQNEDTNTNPNSFITHEDDFMYDNNNDEENEDWINNVRRKYIQIEKNKPLPNSDAVLNCPCCMSLLCLDCQRHETYKSQYRAMFVQNCDIDETKTITYPPLETNHKKKSKRHKNLSNNNFIEFVKQGEAPDSKSTDNELVNGDIYKQVYCGVCRTEVAMYDKEEIYHFYNVLASYT